MHSNSLKNKNLNFKNDLTELKKGITMRSRSLLLLTALGLSVLSCTKQVDYKALPAAEKEEVFSKALVNENDDYIYSSSQQNSSMSAEAAFPYFAGENKRVKVKLAKDSLQIIEMERDQRYASNQANNKLVMSIPIEHVEFNCAKDSYQECTNQEQNDATVPWQSRSQVKLKFEEMKSAQLEFLPVIDSETYGENCYETLDAKLVGSKVEADAINFQIERTFKTKLDCLGNSAMDIKDGTFTASFHYSLIKAKSVLSKDYQTVEYQEGSKDENSFGFFSTRSYKRDADHNITENSFNQIMNRWNPNRSVINYYLSNEFNKPEYAKIKELTYKTVDNINTGLKLSGAKFQIKLNEPADKVPGDIRNSMIVLVEDPVASSVIGYGPQTEDPMTGEIISARTIMFLGTIQSFVQSTYADIIREKQALKDAQAVTTQKMNEPLKLSLAPSLKMAVDGRKALSGAQNINQTLSKMMNVGQSETKKSGNDIGIAINPDKIVKDLRTYTKRNNGLYNGKDLKSKFRYLHQVKNCAYTPQSQGAGSGGVVSDISKKLMDQFADDAKAWHLLSESQKQAAIDIILPEIWVPTLIHEMGHNLGLRHNFQGSEDKANFYSDDELTQLGIDHKIPFSSVMEYGDDLKALHVMGKYDIAALRFGYARKVEVVDKNQNVTLVDVKTTLQKLAVPADTELKNYGYCTDEHTGSNAGCRRFDLGTSYTEIVQNLIKQYEHNYEARNLKNGRVSFNMMDDLSYGNRIKNFFASIRTMAEVKEEIKNRYGLDDADPIWEQNEWLKDLKQATILGGAFFAKVLMVPDKTCAVALSAEPTQIIALQNLRALMPEALSCFEIQLRPEYKIVGETGKQFLSTRGENNTSSVIGEIDVRGIWPDKVAAMQTLFNRKMGSVNFDDYKDTYINQPELRADLLKIAQLVMNDNVVDTVEFKLFDGSKANLEIPLDMSVSQQIPEHMYLNALEDYIKRQAGPDRAEDYRKIYANSMELSLRGKTTLQQVVSKVIAREAIDNDGTHPEDSSLKPVFSVYQQSKVDSNPISRKNSKLELDELYYIATDSNVLAKSFMTNLDVAQTVEALKDDKKAVAIYQARAKNETMPATATALEKAVWDMDMNLLQAYLMGVIKGSAYYKETIKGLPVMQ